MYVYVDQLSSTLVIVVSTNQLIVCISKVTHMIVMIVHGTVQNVLSTDLPYVRLGFVH